MRISIFCALLATALVCAPLHAHPGASSTIEHYSHQIEHHPDQQALHIQRGIAYSADGKYQEALTDFERAQALGDPLLVSFDLGVLHYRRGDFDAAENHFNNYLQRFPQHSGCLEYRARLRRDKGDYKGSIADFQRFFALASRPNPGHYISVARMLATNDGKNGAAQALEILDAGNSKLGLTPQLQYYAIELEQDRDRTDLAVQRMEALQPILGESPDWKVGMAELYQENKQLDLANELLLSSERRLRNLRPTPARIELQERLARAQRSIES